MIIGPPPKFHETRDILAPPGVRNNSPVPYDVSQARCVDVPPFKKALRRPIESRVHHLLMYTFSQAARSEGGGSVAEPGKPLLAMVRLYIGGAGRTWRLSLAGGGTTARNGLQG